jgi:glycerol kinase
MVINDTLMQFQSDILGKSVIRPRITETTALGAAYAAGLAVGFWSTKEALKGMWQEERRFEAQMSEEHANRMYSGWKKAVVRSLDWIDEP